MPVCVKQERNGPPSADQGFLQPAITAAMCCHPESDTHPPILIPPFLLVHHQNGIAPTDNMLRFHSSVINPLTTNDDYRHHQIRPQVICWRNLF